MPGKLDDEQNTSEMISVKAARESALLLTGYLSRGGPLPRDLADALSEALSAQSQREKAQARDALGQVVAVSSLDQIVLAGLNRFIKRFVSNGHQGRPTGEDYHDMALNDPATLREVVRLLSWNITKIPITDLDAGFAYMSDMPTVGGYDAFEHMQQPYVAELRLQLIDYLLHLPTAELTTTVSLAAFHRLFIRATGMQTYPELSDINQWTTAAVSVLETHAASFRSKLPLIQHRLDETRARLTQANRSHANKSALAVGNVPETRSIPSKKAIDINTAREAINKFITSGDWRPGLQSPKYYSNLDSRSLADAEVVATVIREACNSGTLPPATICAALNFLSDFDDNAGGGFDALHQETVKFLQQLRLALINYFSALSPPKMNCSREEFNLYYNIYCRIVADFSTPAQLKELARTNYRPSTAEVQRMFSFMQAHVLTLRPKVEAAIQRAS